MKSLDEVIKANECCDHGEPDSRCEDCPYKGIGACCAKRESDALYYLKMYRSDMQMYSENQKYWEDELKLKIKDFGDAKERYIKRLKELDIGTLNEPLTWDELKQMEGKPVWVEQCNGDTKGWFLILRTNYGVMHYCTTKHGNPFFLYKSCTVNDGKPTERREMKIGELFEGGYLVCWVEAELLKPKDMTEVIAHLKDARYDEYASDYVIGYYHENGDLISDGVSHVDFRKIDYYMNIPPLPYQKEWE